MQPTDQQRHAMKPTRFALFWRTFFPYQVVRFVIINLRMLVMIGKSHGGRRPVEKRLTGATREALAQPPR